MSETSSSTVAVAAHGNSTRNAEPASAASLCDRDQARAAAVKPRTTIETGLARASRDWSTAVLSFAPHHGDSRVHRRSCEHDETAAAIATSRRRGKVGAMSNVPNRRLVATLVFAVAGIALFAGL